MSAPCHIRSVCQHSRGFTLVELLATIAILAVLVVSAMPYIADYISWGRSVSDSWTLQTLNSALTRYKGEGGDVTALTSGAPISNVLTRLKTPVTWGGSISHQFVQSAFTCAARSLFGKGAGSSYRFSAYNNYTAETGGQYTGTQQRIFLTNVGAGTWATPGDWNNGANTIECIGGGGKGGNDSNNTGGGGGGAYARISNLTVTPGDSISYGVGGSGGDTFFNAISLADAQSKGSSVACAADHGRNSSTYSGGVGGSDVNSVGTTKYSGGNGGTGAAGGHAGAGGGGSAGPFGPGANGGNAQYNDGGGGGGGASGGSAGNSSPGAGLAGNGGNNRSGIGGGNAANVSAHATAGISGGGGGGGVIGKNAAAGGNGTDWDSNHGAGGGGGGDDRTFGYGSAGLYGGGGGGFGNNLGAQGIIVITYTPLKTR